ncbi:15279_t:CDS:2 [Funneliformis geosporum]|uniref:15279_t:CDS:1 n=1 Tax=Funneliformis geosporum TaxID=1117311 RepID=A0A9W4SAM4_9GLOM|nr:15279_t:CDS:2 [Funneliformis geosporum]
MPTLNLKNITIKKLEDRNLNPYYLIINQDNPEEAFFCFEKTVKDEVEIEFTENENNFKTYRKAEDRKKEERLDINSDELEGELNLNDFINLEILFCHDNKLTSLDLTNCKKLRGIEELKIGNDEECEEETISNIYNRFYGSLKPLKNLVKLEVLDINNTDIDSGYEYLPSGVKKVYCSTKERVESKSQDYGFSCYLTKQGYTPKFDKNYPQEQRSKVEEIYLNESSLEGELDLGDFTYKYGIKIYISSKVDEAKLVLRNLLKNAKIILQDPRKYLQQKYPTNKEEIICVEENIEGMLDLSNFVNVEELYCSYNKLTALNLSKCYKLEEINLTLPVNPTNLRKLNLNNNNFPERDLSFLKGVISLEELMLNNNKFTGSLDYLSEMERLWWLDISNTDLNKVNLDKLPHSLEKFEYSTKERPGCKLTAIVPRLEVHK